MDQLDFVLQVAALVQLELAQAALVHGSMTHHPIHATDVVKTVHPAVYPMPYSASVAFLDLS